MTVRYPQIPITPYTKRENHGLLIYFLSEFYDKSKSSQKFLKKISIQYCEECDVREITNVYYMLSECLHVSPDDITLEDALKYVSESTLETFKTYHPRDQFDYLEKVYQEYTDYWPMSQTSCNQIYFCSGCCSVWLMTSYCDDIYECGEKGCDVVYCESCKLERHFSQVVSSFSSYMWFHDCKCRKHDTLFEALYTILFLEK